MTLIFLKSCTKNERIKYSFIGEYEYQISDSTKFNETTLSQSSFGYTFGDLNIQGMNIIAPKKIKENKSNQYIISLNSEINDVKLNFGCNCYPKDYFPLEVMKKNNRKNNKVFVYKIEDKRIFKHILP